MGEVLVPRELHSSGRRGQEIHSINIEWWVLLRNKIELELLWEDRWVCEGCSSKGYFRAH